MPLPPFAIPVARNGGVSALSLDPTGRWLGLGRDYGDLQVWDCWEGGLARRGSHSGRVSALASSPDGGLLISAGYDGYVKIFSLHDPILLQVLDLRGCGKVLALACSLDGRLATGSENGEVQLWSLPEGRLLATADGQRLGAVYALNFIGDTLLIGYQSGYLVACHSENGHFENKTPAFQRPLSAIAATFDGNLLAMGSQGQGIRLHLPGDWQLHATLRTPAPVSIASLSFSPDGTQLAAACSDGILRRWDCRGRNPITLSSCGEGVETVLRAEAMISGLAWAPDGQAIYTAQMDGTVRLWHPARSVVVPTLELSPLEGQSFVVTAPDGRRDASVGLPLGPSPSPDLWRLAAL